MTRMNKTKQATISQKSSPQKTLQNTPPSESEFDWRVRVFDSLSFPTRILKADTTVIAVNDIYLQQTGEQLADVVGRPCEACYHLEAIDHLCPCTNTDIKDCPIRKTVETKTAQSVVLQNRGNDGKERWEDRIFSPILGDDGEVQYIIESVRDVTRIKTLEKMYSGVRELMEKLVQSSVSGIMAADRSGNIMLMNKAAEKLFGYTIEEADTVTIEDFYPPGTARAIMRKLRDPDIGEKGKLPATKVNILTKGQEEIPVEMTAAILYEEEKEAATAAIFNDLRERLLVEKQLSDAQTQVMQSEKMASLGRLAAGVAHEINNPLTSILLYGNMMQEKLEEDHPLSQNLEYILDDAERCREIVKNLLAYSRQTRPTKNIFEINNLVLESFSLIRDQRLFMNVEVIKDLVPYPVLVNADKNQLCQVVINLIMNAFDAMEGQGTLTIKTYRNKKDEKVFIEVGDTGCGVPEDNISKIFDPFFTTKDPGQGTGLGLSMAYGILEKNKGSISIKETGPHGTTFLMELPEEVVNDEFLYISIG